ncbi:MAG: hypothetical protein SGJ20_22560 [Planctomycetota bacterium]|nr:hypothetical protein [Planctomycetota bacterium]
MEVASHNIGVLALLRAVAVTEKAQNDTPDDITDDLACVPLWREAFDHLRRGIESDSFWMRQRLRAKELHDPRLNAARLEEIRAGFLAEIIAPIGNVITSALLAGHAKVATVYVDLLRQSGFAKTNIEKVLSSVYKPLADRVESHVTDLKAKLDKIGVVTAVESDYARLLRAFERDVSGDLKVMLEVGDLPGYAEEHARDKAAEFLRMLSINAWNDADSQAVSKRAIQLAMQIADANSLKERLSSDLSDLTTAHRNNAKSAELAPLYKQLTAALEAKKWIEALRLIDQLIAADARDQSELRTLRTKVSSCIATEWFNEAIVQANNRNFGKAHELLDGAMRYETDPKEKLIISTVQAKIPRNSPGCLAVILVMIASLVLAGLAGGTVYAYIT